MGIRKERKVEITSCVPLISKYVKDLEDYKNKLNIIKKDIEKEIKKQFIQDDCNNLSKKRLSRGIIWKDWQEDLSSTL